MALWPCGFVPLWLYGLVTLWPCVFVALWLQGRVPCSLFPFVPFRLVRLVVLVCGLLFGLVIGLSLGLSLVFGIVWPLVALFCCLAPWLPCGVGVGAFELTQIGGVGVGALESTKIGVGEADARISRVWRPLLRK